MSPLWAKYVLNAAAIRCLANIGSHPDALSPLTSTTTMALMHLLLFFDNEVDGLCHRMAITWDFHSCAMCGLGITFRIYHSVTRQRG